MNWFLYDRDVRIERVKVAHVINMKLGFTGFTD